MKLEAEMKAGYADVFVAPKAQALPVALVAQSSGILAQNADSLRRTIEEFILSNPMVEPGACYGGEEMEDPIARIRGKGETLAEHLDSQLRMNESDPAILHTGWYIINSLDRDGYLREEEQELIRASGSNALIYQKALRAVQSLEPAGVGARSLSECLCIQLRMRGEPHPLAAEIAARHLEELAAHTLKIEGYTPEQLEEAAGLIRSLDPRPGLAFDGESTVYIAPDVRIEFNGEGQLEVSLVNQPAHPTLCGQYAEYLKIDNQVEKQYVQDNLLYARSFLYALEQRGRTLLRIAVYAAEKQKAYLQTRDLQTLSPLNFSNTADVLGMSVSSVSRAVQDKYAQCGGRIFPIRSLFTAGGCANASREAIVARIRRLCRETPGVLTDRAIAETLSAEGILISRRAVNKYRNLYLAGEESGA